MPERLGTEQNVGSEERLPEMTTTLTEVDGPGRETANVGRSDPSKPQHDSELVSVDNVQGRLMHEVGRSRCGEETAVARTTGSRSRIQIGRAHV